MDSSEFLKSIMNEQFEKDLMKIGETQSENLKKIIVVAKESLENLGKIYDEIKTPSAKKELERQMNNLGKLIMDNEGQLEVLETVIKGMRGIE